jgi:hypothetical protein
MKIATFDFFCYDLRGNKTQNTATVTFIENTNTPVHKVKFSKQVKNIDLIELRGLMHDIEVYKQNLYENNIYNENQTVGELKVIYNPLQLIKKSNFEKFKDFVFGGLENEKAKGNLTPEEQKQIENAKKLMKFLTGNK